MAHLAFIVATTKAGLQEVAQDADYEILEGSEMEFDSVTTFSDAKLSSSGAIETGKTGWLAIGRA